MDLKKSLRFQLRKTRRCEILRDIRRQGGHHRKFNTSELRAQSERRERMKEKRYWKRMTEESAECMIHTKYIKPDKYKDIHT